MSAYTRSNGTHVVSYTRDRRALGDLASLGRASTMTVATRWAGRAFLIVEVGIGAWEHWNQSESESVLYRLTYTGLGAAAQVGGVVIGAQGGAAFGGWVGCHFGAWGCAIGGGLGM